MALDKVERAILGLCLECLSIKDKIIAKGEANIISYCGGERSLDVSGNYERVVRLYGKGRKDLPEEVIDLREVSCLYKKRTGFATSGHQPYREVINTLKNKGYFQYIEGDRQQRFVKLNKNMLNGYADSEPLKENRK
ncbi:MAG: hypothetical protein JW883_15775 [Deltaproteobacteria bacterium]|nr:hypothetical protein [Deltaproteobacteria bacterium]